MRVLLAGIALCALCSCGGRHVEAPVASEGEPDKVRLALNWYPEAQHGGYYAALAHGYYDEVGLDVEILPGGADAPVISRVATGSVDFGVANADVLFLGRAQRTPVVALMAPLQMSPRCIMVHEESGIRRFEDLRDITLSMTVTGAFSHFLRRRAPLEGVKIVPYTGNIAPFLLSKDHAQQGYIFSEPYLARQQGANPHCLMLSDIGFNPYTSMLVAGESLVRERPDVARRMVQASLRGWLTYLDAPEVTNAYINRINPEMGMEILAYGVESMRPLTQEGDVGSLGMIRLERMQSLLDQMVEIGLVEPGVTRAQDAFDIDYLLQGMEG